MFCVAYFVLFFGGAVVAREISDEDLYRLPKLFHLDDYDRCLSQKQGVYCVGTFELTPKTKPNPAYDLITEQPNTHFFVFDRRLIHRGYCVNERCRPGQNTTLRFEQCADRLLRKYDLTARLAKLSYCTTHAQRQTKLAEEPDLPQQLFLYVVYIILALNVLGTLQDVLCDGKKKNFLTAWSIPANWRALTTVSDGDSLFAPVQSSKIILHSIIIYTHANLLYFMSFIQNPEYVEKYRDGFVSVVIRNGTSLVQIFILISSFFTGYNLLETARKSPVPVGVRLVARWLLKRIFRLAPVYLLLTAYSATWWPRYSDGPLWSSLVEAESQVCREKFWTHLLFVNNFVRPWDLCMVQSWAMATEIQLFLVSLLLTLLLMKLKVRAVPVLGAMFIVSCLFHITLAYAAGLVPMVRVIVPELLRVLFRGSKSFFHLHTSPWSSLPACLFGLLVAHIHFEQKYKNKAKTEDREKETNTSYESIPNENGKQSIRNGLHVKKNGIHVKENGLQIKENGIQKENGDLIKENGIPVKRNGLHIKENGVHVKKNGLHTKEKGVPVRENGIHIKENGVQVKENGLQTKENCVPVKKNGVHIKENGIRVKENGVNFTANCVRVQENGVNDKENDAHIKQNGVTKCVNGNGIHFTNNSVITKEHNGFVVQTDSDENGVFMNGIRNRKVIEIQNGVTDTDYVDKKSNGSINGIAHQNGHCKLNGYGNQKESSLEKKTVEKKVTLMLRYAHLFTFPVLLTLIVTGSRVAEVESPALVALYVGLERLMFSLAFACQLLQIITVKGPWARLLSWPGWTVPARLVLSVAMVHWCVNVTIVASRPQPMPLTMLYASIDWLATLFYSYVIALPICVLVELPMKKALDALIS